MNHLVLELWKSNPEIMLRSSVRNNPNEGRGVPNLAYQALLREMERMMQNQLKPIQEWLDQLEGRPHLYNEPIYNHNEDVYLHNEVVHLYLETDHLMFLMLNGNKHL
ncbi:hypothetical protein PVK06_047807 [Gossypium arboreum]|uniref:Uncharacterized protein n=1 Tax=Gossypium arboreum TaxID=29729 RepID=A0ABR0ME95_GOSAR|nr:hypothetical protein PVK06_047807 [Gossypium arboreum]